MEQLLSKTGQMENKLIKQKHQLIVVITGCAVAQHCYNGDVSFLWEKWKL